MTAKAPNILIVMADQMAPAFLPIYGHSLVRAPNMQALAQDGIPALVKIDRRRAVPSPPAAALPRLLSSVIPNGRVASPDQPITDRSDETSEANTTTELR